MTFKVSLFLILCVKNTHVAMQGTYMPGLGKE